MFTSLVIGTLRRTMALGGVVFIDDGTNVAQNLAYNPVRRQLFALRMMLVG